MIIAQEKRKTNIAEFILYMWQVEDLIRSSKFNFPHIDKIVISKFSLPDETLTEIRTWYTNLITLMIDENIQERGHMSFLTNLIRELNDLHLRLLHSADEKKYQQIYQKASENIKSLKQKSPETYSSEIEVCLTGLYGYLMLRLQQSDISAETKAAMTSFSNLLAALSNRFREIEEGLKELP
jgi:flagellin-specific chaperone FliS